MGGWLCLALALTAVEAPLFAAAEAVHVFPVEPEDGATVGGWPVFVIGHEPIEESGARALRHRLELRSRTATVEPYDFDQRRRTSGWMPGEPGRTVFRPRRPLDDGTYTWRVWYWDGVEWVGGDAAFDLVIDRVPPSAPRLVAAIEGAELHLQWPPVTEDAGGRPELVDVYRVYRFTVAPPFPLPPSGEIAVTELPDYREPIAGPEVLVFYRVVAEDRARNRSDGLPLP